MIAKQPSERYQSMDELIEVFMELLPRLPEGTISEPEFSLPRSFLVHDSAATKSAEKHDVASQRTPPESTVDYGAHSDAELRLFIAGRGSSDHRKR